MLLFKNSRYSSDGPSRSLLLEAAHGRLRATKSQDDVITVVRDAARGIFGAEGVTFVLREHSMCHYVEEDAMSPLWKGQRFPMTACISGWAMLNGRSAAIADVFADARIPHEVYRKTFVKSLIMAPVGMDTPVAAIGAYWREKRAFSGEDIQTVETLAGYVGQALKRAQAA